MSMYDTVIYKSVPCRDCKQTIEASHEWQTKDRLDEMWPRMERLTPSNVASFYTVCPHCKAWNEYRARTASDHELVPAHD